MKYYLHILTALVFLTGCTTQYATSDQKTEAIQPDNTQQQTEQTNLQPPTYTQNTSNTITDQSSSSYTEVEAKNTMFTLDGITLQAPEHYRVEITKTSHLSFDAYAAHQERYLISELIQANAPSPLSQAELSTQLKQFEGRYSFSPTNINGFDVLMHKRDFFGIIGDVYEAHIYIDAGQVLVLTDELNHAQLDQTLRTIKK